MDYYPLKTDEEFYKIIKDRKKEVDFMNIPKSEKDKLYSWIEENIKSREERKERMIKGEKMVKELEKTCSDWGKSSIEEYNRGEEVMTAMNRLYKEGTRAKKNIEQTTKNMNIIKENVYKIERNMKENIKKREANDFFEEVDTQLKKPKIN